jgi:response regulator RpfG family c-di-GMP phosphodiesterase
MILKPSYDVHTVTDGMAALKFLEKNSVDLITLDLKMPGLSGMEVLEEIRNSNPDVMVIIVTGYGTFKSVVEAIHLNVFDYISKPFNISEIISVVERCLEMRHTKLALKDVFREIAGLSETDSSESHLAKVIKKTRESFCGDQCFHTGSNDVTFLEVFRAVSKGIEKRDPYTTGHSERVGHYTDFAAQKLGLSQPVREETQIASYLHDIGKVCISSRFMNGEGKLSSTDWAILKRHPVQSVELIGPLNLASSVVSAIRHHHERFDGTGYPDGLAGNDIALGARLISIGDTYDALTSKRPYRNAMSAVEARAEIQKYVGSYFDPDLVRIFLEALKGNRDSSRLGDVNWEPDKEGS